jgi:dynein assembly factor 3
VYEDNAAALARHMILLAIFLDNNLEVNVRMRRFLEIFGNALLREDTADYLSTKCKVLEIMLEQMLGGAEVTDQTLARLIDIKNLSFEAKDALTEALTGAAKGSTYNMAKAWESRCRLWYGQRYDFRRNIVCPLQMHLTLLWAPIHIRMT